MWRPVITRLQFHEIMPTSRASRRTLILVQKAKMNREQIQQLRSDCSNNKYSIAASLQNNVRARLSWRGTDGLVWLPSIAPVSSLDVDEKSRRSPSRSFRNFAVERSLASPLSISPCFDRTVNFSESQPTSTIALSKRKTVPFNTYFQRRLFSKVKDDDETNTGSSAKERTQTQVTDLAREKLSLSKPMDPDFQKYLTGEMSPPVSERPRRRRHRLPDPDKELFARIQKKQLLQKEESRLKTAQNVYRALLGNVIICGAKLGAWVSSGSSGMLAEFIHSVVDCGNQALLLVGLRDSRLSPDRTHPYGYGKSVYFWALVSALGTFFLGAGVSMTHAISDVLEPSLHDITWHVWGVLLLSLAVDGYVLAKTFTELRESQPEGVTFYKHLSNLRDPATLAILLEDGAACLGVVLALGGIVATHVTGNPVFDGLAGVGISALLGGMGIILVRVNHRFLLGRAVDKEIIEDINKILMSRRSIDSIGSVQSQWTGPDTFSYKAEVDFDGTYLAATLMKFYQQEFLKIRDSMEDELQGTKHMTGTRIACLYSAKSLFSLCFFSPLL